MYHFDLTISGRNIPVNVIKHSRYRRCSLKVTENGVRVMVPLLYPDCQWKKFLNKNSSWILKKYIYQKSKTDNIPQLVQGGRIPFYGGEYPVDLMAVEDVIFTGERFQIPDTENKQKQLTLWYIKKAYKIALNLVDIWYPEFGDKLKEIRLKNMRSRWGSCTDKGKVSLNWRLVMAPEAVFEYVFVHELCHLRVNSHGAEFWELVEKAIPHSKKHRLWLKKYGYILTHFPEPVKSSSTVASIYL